MTGLLCALALAAAPAPKAEELAAALPRGQAIVQLFAAELDEEPGEETIALSEPTDGQGELVVTIFDRSVQPAAVRFQQRIRGAGLARVGGVVRRVEPIGPVVVVVGAAPASVDSRFVVQLYAFSRGQLRPLLPEPAEFRSFGGFGFADVLPSSPGEELVTVSRLLGPGERAADPHAYELLRFAWDGRRFVAGRTIRTPVLLPDAVAATRAAGLSGDLRRELPRVAEVP